MPDLASLLADEVRRLYPTTVPPYESLVRRARRRRTTQVVAAVAAVVFVLGGGVGVVVSHSGDTAARSVNAEATSAPPAPPVPEAVYEPLHNRALALAKAYGLSGLVRLEAVQVDDLNQAWVTVLGRAHAFTMDPVSTSPGWVLEMEGVVACGPYCRLPANTGSLQFAAVPDGTGLPRGINVPGQWVDLHAVGSPFSVLQPYAQWGRPLSPSPSPLVLSSVTASAAVESTPAGPTNAATSVAPR